mgnify:CR=1 FL=1|jgi:hypothetical protein
MPNPENPVQKNTNSVAPQTAPEKTPKNILVGGIKNALSHGENLEKVKKSFLNAGYSQQEVDEAVQKANATPQESDQKSLNTLSRQQNIQTPQLPNSSAQQNPNLKNINQEIQKNQQPNKPASKKYWIIMGVVSLLLIIIAATLGIFWDKIFG